MSAAFNLARRSPRLLATLGLRGPKIELETPIIPPLARQRTAEPPALSDSRASAPTRDAAAKEVEMPQIEEFGISTEVTIAALPFRRELIDCAIWFSRMTLGDLVHAIRRSEALGQFTAQEADALVASAVQTHVTDAVEFESVQEERGFYAALLTRLEEPGLAALPQEHWNTFQEGLPPIANSISSEPAVIQLDTDGHADEQCLRVARRLPKSRAKQSAAPNRQSKSQFQRLPHVGTQLNSSRPQPMGREFADILMWTGLMSFGDHVRALRWMEDHGQLSKMETTGLIIGLCQNYANVAKPLQETLVEVGEAELVAQLLEDCNEASLAAMVRNDWDFADALSLREVRDITEADGVIGVGLSDPGYALRMESAPAALRAIEASAKGGR